MIIAEDWEATAMAKHGNFPKRFIIDGFGDNDNRRVGGTDREFLIDAAETPFICLKKIRMYRIWVRKQITTVTA